MKIKFMPFLRKAELNSAELNNFGSCCAAALEVDPLSENIVSTSSRKFREKASKKLFKSRLITSSTCIARVQRHVKRSLHALQSLLPNGIGKVQSIRHHRI